MMKRACENCDYWVAHRKPADWTEQKTGDCRRHAPIPVYAHMCNHEPARIWWPNTGHKFWCGDFIERQHPVETVEHDDLLDRSIDVLQLSARVRNTFREERIDTIRDILDKSESQFLRMSNFGMKSLNEIKEAIAKYDLHLVQTWHPSNSEWQKENRNADSSPGNV